jgi:hypothetical protein
VGLKVHIHATKSICEFQVEIQYIFRMELLAHLRYISDFFFKFSQGPVEYV